MHSECNSIISQRDYLLLFIGLINKSYCKISIWLVFAKKKEIHRIYSALKLVFVTILCIAAYSQGGYYVFKFKHS